eukprot:SAG31_NODE_28461_length_410_cov_0.665595_2_plen_44_part_01
MPARFGLGYMEAVTDSMGHAKKVLAQACFLLFLIFFRLSVQFGR